MCGRKFNIQSQTSTVQFVTEKWFHSTLYDGCNYLSMIEVKAPRGVTRRMWGWGRGGGGGGGGGGGE